MSIRAIAWAFEQDVPPTSKLVLLKLADNANDEGWCWPAQSTLARHTSLTRETVNRHISKLEAAGLLAVKRRTQEGVNLPNYYRLNLGGVVTEDHTGCDRRSQGVVTEDHTNRQKATVTEPKESARPQKPDWVDQQVWSDLLAARRAKKAPLTATAWSRIEGQIREGESKGYDPNDMLAEMVAAGWQGFRVDWYERRTGKNSATARNAVSMWLENGDE